ncbi:MAG: tetratricopeptide repeat protein [Elusimicrobia bacterium]|nr:tetratricopeptide repeat protein [Elusimicrobiota bacterium]
MTEAALALLAALAYLPSLAGVFQFDDFNVIVYEPTVHSWAALAARPGIRPLLKASYVLSWSLGLGPIGFTAFNVAVHALNAVLLYRIGLLVCRRWSVDSPWAALAAAALFALHPAQTEAVTYISGRSSSFMSCGYLGALLLYLQGGRVLASAFLFALACAVKETALTLPAALVLCDLKLERRQAAHWALLAAGAAVLAVYAPYRSLLSFGFGERGAFENLRAQADGIFYLIARLLTLRGYNIDPGLPVPASWTPALVAEALSLSALLALGIYWARRRPWAGFGLLWFFLQLAPTNSFIPRLDVANDRQLYLACWGPLLALCVEVSRLRVPLPWKAGAAVAAALAFSVPCILRQLDYSSEIRLWQSSVALAPRNARAHNNLGTAYEEAGRVDDARESYRTAVALEPGYQRARVNLRLLDAH